MWGALFETILSRSCISLFLETQKWPKDNYFKSGSLGKVVLEEKSRLHC